MRVTPPPFGVVHGDFMSSYIQNAEKVLAHTQCHLCVSQQLHPTSVAICTPQVWRLQDLIGTVWCSDDFFSPTLFLPQMPVFPS